MTENSKIRLFWDVSESQISKFSSTMLKVWLLKEKISKISLFWDVSKSQISKLSSTMVKVWLWQKTVKLGYSGTFQKVKFQNFLQQSLSCHKKCGLLGGKQANPSKPYHNILYHGEDMTMTEKGKLFCFQSGYYTFELVLFSPHSFPSPAQGPPGYKPW